METMSLIPTGTGRTPSWSPATCAHWLAPSSVCGGGGNDHGPQSLVMEPIAHSAATVTVEVTTTLDQNANDESFGVDNVVIKIP